MKNLQLTADGTVANADEPVSQQLNELIQSLIELLDGSDAEGEPIIESLTWSRETKLLSVMYSGK